MNIPKILNKKEIYNNKWRNITIKILETKTWKLQEYPIQSHVWPELATMILPITKEREVIYCKEWRPWIEGFVYSFPVWMQEKELSFEENAIKELKEEVWATTKDINYLWESIAANFDTTIVKYFIAHNCKLWKNSLEDWEYIEVQKCSLEEFEQKIVSWEINCPLTMSCYTKAKLQNKI